MHKIELTLIMADRRADLYSDSDDPDEGARVAAGPVTQPVTVSVDAIRSFTARRGDAGPGTRITFKDGGAFRVAESYDRVLELVGPAMPSAGRFN